MLKPVEKYGMVLAMTLWIITKDINAFCDNCRLWIAVSRKKGKYEILSADDMREFYHQKKPQQLQKN